LYFDAKPEQRQISDDVLLDLACRFRTCGMRFACDRLEVNARAAR
jgi:hypothetical protein